MKILVVGGTGTIGQFVVNELASTHDIITAGYSKGDIQVDLSSFDSIKALYESVGNIDAVICTAGKVSFAPVAELDDSMHRLGIDNKLMGQINLVQVGLNYVNQNGSFTLTSGILNHEPIATGASAAMVNGALEGFVVGAAIELPKGLRINLVSPTVLTESLEVYGNYFPGFESVSGARVAKAYKKSVEGLQTGQIFKIGF